MSGPRGETRARARQAALTLFADRGYGATTLQDIADATGVTKAALYYYFRTRHDILLDIADPVLGRIDAILTAAEQDPAPPGEKLQELFTTLGELTMDEAPAIGILVLDPTIRTQTDLSARWEALGARMKRLIAGDQGGVATEARAVAALCATLMPVLSLHESTERDTVVHAAVSAACAVAGVPAPAARERVRGAAG